MTRHLVFGAGLLLAAALGLAAAACSNTGRSAPCPADVPQSGSACTAAGATCGYVTSASACDGSMDCYCQGGAWSCGPTCALFDASVAEADVAVRASESGAGRVPLNHRPSSAQCSTPAPPGDCAGPYPDGGGCASDSDCSEAGANGRCINRGGGPAAPCACTDDKCSDDTDCPGGQTCACHGAPYTGGSGTACVKGNCRIDADCGPEGYCSPSATTALCGDSLAGYYCHTAADLCIDDGDCPESATVVGSPGCVYSATDSRWECLVLPVCL